MNWTGWNKSMPRVVVMLLSFGLGQQSLSWARKAEAPIKGGTIIIEDLSTERLDYPEINQDDNNVCFESHATQHVFLRGIQRLNIWDSPLYLNARFPYGEIARRPFYIINSSALNSTLQEPPVINLINGLFGVASSNTKSAAPQSVCDQSAVSLLILLRDHVEYSKINSSLPDGFAESTSIQSSDCNRSRVFGLQLLGALDHYQKDCWAFCFSNERAGFRKGLGPFDKDFENGDNKFVSPFQRGISNVMIRLLTCCESGWFDADISQATYQVLAMCASARGCAAVCAGIVNETDAVDHQLNYRRFIDSANTLGPKEKSKVMSPSVVPGMVLSILQVANRFAQHMSEDSAGPIVAIKIDSLTNPKSGSCQSYDSVLANFLSVSGGDLSPFWELRPSDYLPSVRAVRNSAFAACKSAIKGLADVCVQEASDLCARSSNPSVEVIGSFDSCLDTGLGSFWEAITAYNAHCATIGFPAKPINAPARQYYYFSEGQLSMNDCFQNSHVQIANFFAVFITMWILVALCLIYFRLSGRQWLCSCDITMDVSRSRAFTVSGTLWLLYFFYRFTYQYLRHIKLNSCSKGWPECGGFYFPFVIYLFIVCFMWVAAFGWVFIANNPHREKSDIISVLGVMACHYYTYLLSVQSLKDLDLFGDDFALRCEKFFEILLICLLQAALDLCFLRVILRKWIGSRDFHHFRGQKYTDYVTSALNKHAAADGGNARVFLTCAISTDEMEPSPEDLFSNLVHWIGHHCFVLVSIGHGRLADDSHRKRASLLKLSSDFDRVLSIEILLVPSMADLDHVLRLEYNQAIKCGSKDQAERFLAQREKNRVKATCAYQLRRNALLLSKILSSDLFCEVLGDRLAERHFESVMAALHDFCRAHGNALPDRAAPETRERFLSAFQASGVENKYLGLLCSAPESDLMCLTAAATSSFLDAENLAMNLVSKIYRRGRTELLARLSTSEFLNWLDDGMLLDSEHARIASRNPFALESNALDSFRLSQCQEKPEAFDLDNIITSLVSDIQIGKSPALDKRKGILRKIIGLSREYKAWQVWANEDMTRVKNKNFGGNMSFTPSILYICVGISVTIIMSNYVYQLAYAVRTKDWLASVLATMLFFISVFENMATSFLGLATCIDPVLLDRMRGIEPEQYVQNLVNWPPLALQIEHALQHSNLTLAQSQSTRYTTNKTQNPTAIVLDLFLSIIANISQPEILSTLPIFGPALGCIYRQFNHPQIKAFINESVTAIVAETSRSQVRVSSASTDPCSSELRKAFPISQYERQQFLDLVSTANLIPEQHSVYRDHAQQLETISKPCQLYITMGCSFVLNLKIVGESSSSWTRYLNASAGRITKNYVSPVNKTMNFISHYTETRFLPCWILGHTISVVLSISASMTVLSKFKKRIIQMRKGNNPYKSMLEKIPLSNFSTSSTPALGGMAVATAFAQYYIFAYVFFVVLCIATTGFIYASTLTVSLNTPVRILFEVALGVITVRLLTKFSDLVIFRDGQLAQPVLWSWFSTYLLVVNLIRGILSGITRIAIMCFWIVVQIGVVDHSNFPSGKEHYDPVFSAFFETLNFHHRYRNPVFTAFVHRYATRDQRRRDSAVITEQSTRAAASNPDGIQTPLQQSVQPGDNIGDMQIMLSNESPGCILSVNDTSESNVNDNTDTTGQNIRRRARWLVAYTLHRNPAVVGNRSIVPKSNTRESCGRQVAPLKTGSNLNEGWGLSSHFDVSSSMISAGWWSESAKVAADAWSALKEDVLGAPEMIEGFNLNDRLGDSDEGGMQGRYADAESTQSRITEKFSRDALNLKNLTTGNVGTSSEPQPDVTDHWLQRLADTDSSTDQDSRQSINDSFNACSPFTVSSVEKFDIEEVEDIRDSVIRR